MPRIDLPRLRGRILVYPLAALLLSACGGSDPSGPAERENRPPVLRRLEFSVPRVHAAEEVFVVAGAEDPDDDPLSYFWYTTRGTFPLGRVGNSIRWRTPDTLGTDTLTVRITDAEDTLFAQLPVDLVLVQPPDSVWTANFPSVADIRWRRSPDHEMQSWVGYEVYMAGETLAGRSEEEILPFLLTPNPVRATTARALSLVTGRKYYFHVRSVRRFSGRTERSVFAHEVVMAPRPGGDASLIYELASPQARAFDLSSGRVRSLDPEDASGRAETDLYFAPRDGSPSGPIHIRSVSHLAAFDAAWGDRVVEMKHVGTDWEVSSADTTAGWVTEAPILELDVFAVRTPEGHYGKLQVTNIEGFAPNRNVWVRWAYQTVPGFVSF